MLFRLLSFEKERKTKVKIYSPSHCVYTAHRSTLLLSYVVASVRVRIYLAVRKRIFSSNKQKRNFACPEQASKRARKSRGRKVPDRREGAKTSTMLARGYWRCLDSRIHEAALIETSLCFLKILVASQPKIQQTKIAVTKI